MSRVTSLEELFVKELRDLYSAEKQLTSALPKMARAAANDDLRSAIEEHLEQTRGHMERLEQALESLGESTRGPKCKGMEGLIEEGKEHLSETDGATRDAALISSAQRVEHYEIAGYGTAATFAKLLGQEDIAQTLGETLEEEKAADQKLTSIAESHVNQESAGEAPEARGSAARSARGVAADHGRMASRSASSSGRSTSRGAGRARARGRRSR